MTGKAEKPLKEEIVRKALDLAAQRGWDRLTLADIATYCGLSLAQLHDYFEDKTDILTSLGRIIDRIVLENIAPPEPDISSRDRLFDILMERYEALGPYRAGIVSVLNSFRLDPKQMVIALPHLCRSMTWMLEAAAIDTTGIGGAVKVSGLTAIYIKALCTWMKDESADLSKTMASLDRDLTRAEKIAGTFGF